MDNLFSLSESNSRSVADEMRGVQTNRIWLTHEFFIPVNDKGQCVGRCNEGALGFVLQLQSDRRPGFYQALKLPKLTGETARENAYISELLEKELAAVEQVMLKADEQVEIGGAELLQAQVGGGSLLRRQINTRGGDPLASDWHNALVFVRFEKGQNPYFCLVKERDNEIDWHPRTAQCPVPTVERLKEVERKTHNWSTTVFVNHRPMEHEITPALATPPDAPGSAAVNDGSTGATSLRIFSAEQALSESDTGVTWYTCLPSILYAWATGTLQEAIGRNLRTSWSIRQHFELVYRMCRGLHALHAKQMLHADMRPANILYVGRPSDPSSFYLADYGSYAEAGAHAAEQRSEPTSNSVLGPIVATERTSPFYAPERRAGREREDADLAVIMNPGAGAFCYVVLGWRAELVNREDGKPKRELEQYMDPEFLTEVSARATRTLEAGDRVQIRDYIFEVVEEWSLPNLQILKCKQRFWKIYHNRIVVACDDELEEMHTVPVARSIERLQWSAATDLYSLGALALYSVFRTTHLETTALPEAASGQLNGGEGSQPKGGSRIEEEFSQMMDDLSLSSYFSAIWPELEWLRLQLEGNLNADLRMEEYANKEFVRNRFIHPVEEAGRNEEPKEPDTLKTQTIAVVSRLVQTVVGVEQLVKGFNYDLGPFIFFMHFVLRCLHREALVAEGIKSRLPEDWGRIAMPFCKTRYDPPGAGAIAVALERLHKLQNEIVHNPVMGGLRLKDAEDRRKIAGYDPRPDQEIRAEWLQRKAENDKLKAENAILEVNRDELAVAVGKSKREIDILRHKLGAVATTQDELERNGDALSEMINSVDSLVNDLSVFAGPVRNSLKETLLHVQELLAADLVAREQLARRVAALSQPE